MDSSEGRNDRTREREKRDLMSPSALILKPPQAVEVLILHFSLSKWGIQQLQGYYLKYGACFLQPFYFFSVSLWTNSSIPHAHSLSERGVLLHCAPSHPCPLLSEQPFGGPGWPGAQWRMGMGGSTVGVTTLLATWPTASTSTPVVHRAWWHPHTLWGDSVTSAPHQSPMIIWGLKVWLYHHTAISQVVMTLLITICLVHRWLIQISLPGPCTGGRRSLANLRKKLEMWKPISAAEKMICWKTESSSNKGRGKGSSSLRLPQGMVS